MLKLKNFNWFFGREKWFIGYRKRKPFTLPFDSSGFRIISPPNGRFYADPFVIKYNRKNYIFFEDYIYLENKGVISFCEIDENGNYMKPEVVLEKKYHLSYPFLFIFENQMFMIPESHENNTIELYTARNFPYDWRLEKVLMKNAKSVDATLWFSNGKVWMFTTPFDPQRLNTDLCLFYADTIFSDWKAHPQNPVVSNIAGARPAGRVFTYKHSIIRPGQDSTKIYGEALVFNKINRLTELEYSESKVDHVEANWYPKSLCCHTYNFSDDLEVMDGVAVMPDLLKPYVKLRSFLHR